VPLISRHEHHKNDTTTRTRARTTPQEQQHHKNNITTRTTSPQEQHHHNEVKHTQQVIEELSVVLPGLQAVVNGRCELGVDVAVVQLLVQHIEYSF
jgi:hypothetical protein